MTEQTRRYYACKFRPEDGRAYTYHWDGEPFAVGDFVRVNDASGDGWKKVMVVAASSAPAFATKPIIGPHVDDTTLAL